MRKFCGPPWLIGSIVRTGFGQRVIAFVTYARSAVMSTGAAWAERGRARAAARMSRFMSLRINRAVSLFNPCLDAAVDGHDVAESRHAEELGRERPVGVVLAVHED